jgi:hypothetical protein
MQQKPKKAIQIYLEEEQIKWLDENKGPELKRGGLIRTIIREKMDQDTPAARIWRKVKQKNNDQ